MATVSSVRRKTMQAVKSKNTRPEMIVRRLVYGMGYRYRLHKKDLPGKPDMVFGPARKIIFVHGCFWHGHACKRGARMPKTNQQYWKTKLERNKKRDSEHQHKLRAMKWQVLTIWECETRDTDKLAERIAAFLAK